MSSPCIQTVTAANRPRNPTSRERSCHKSPYRSFFDISRAFVRLGQDRRLTCVWPVLLSCSVVCDVGAGVGGCSYGAGPKSYGKDFNDAGTFACPYRSSLFQALKLRPPLLGGGVYATLFAEEGISVWFWTRTDIPDNLTDPSTWGKPTANWPSSSCDIKKFFTHQYVMPSGYPTLSSTDLKSLRLPDVSFSVRRNLSAFCTPSVHIQNFSLETDITICGEYAGEPAVRPGAHCRTETPPPLTRSLLNLSRPGRVTARIKRLHAATLLLTLPTSMRPYGRFVVSRSMQSELAAHPESGRPFAWKASLSRRPSRPSRPSLLLTGEI